MYDRYASTLISFLPILILQFFCDVRVAVGSENDSSETMTISKEEFKETYGFDLPDSMYK